MKALIYSFFFGFLPFRKRRVVRSFVILNTLFGVFCALVALDDDDGLFGGLAFFSLIFFVAFSLVSYLIEPDPTTK